MVVKKNIIKKVTNKTIQLKTVKSKSNFFIVGIGASAGGLEALNLFFDNVPNNSGIAYIIVQHLDPKHKSFLSEIITKHTKMNVCEIIDGLEVKPNHVYTIPPNNKLIIKDGILLLSKITESRRKSRLINTFFNSLAEDQEKNAIGIILSGNGNDGTEGIGKIKLASGLTLVQDLKTAKFKPMPENVIKTKAYDAILKPAQMPAYILNYKPKIVSTSLNKVEQTAPTENQLKTIFHLIHHQTGYDFSRYKINTILRRIQKRTSIHQIFNIEDYILFLKNNPTEIEELFNDFLIGVTTFFRDKEVFDTITTKVITHLIANSQEKNELRIWVCGCSTGEEAYSLAILLNEVLDKKKLNIKVTIFATDIDKKAIKIARAGFYPFNSTTNISPERLLKHFVIKENGYQLKKEIREMVVFAIHNVINDPPFSKLDMITCRNLLIYLSSELQKKIIPIFHYSLNKNGILLLGTSESIGEYESSFSVFDAKIKIYNKKTDNITRKYNTLHDFTYNKSELTTARINNTMINKKINISLLTEKILLDNYAPPSVIIDKKNKSLYFSGNISQYLEVPIGEANLNILEFAKRGLKLNLEAAIKKARATNAIVETNNIDIKVNNHYQTINLIVKPILLKEKDLGVLMIIFETADRTKSIALQSESKPNASKKINPSSLEKELEITRNNLQTVIDELKNTNEDLQITNEEFQSSNEELQSTNEELETSREELQSVNEELITVNSELSTKIEQLSQANDDLDNLLSSIEIATVFLDRNLNIKRFTPAATKIFNLIPTDIDRPVTHLTGNLLYKGLATDVIHALKTLATKAAEVQAIDGTWYNMRILPYRTSENIIEGVLVTFIDITDQKKNEYKLKKVNESLNMILERLPIVPYICLTIPKLNITYVGKNSEKVMGFLPEQFTKKIAFWLSRIHPSDKRKITTSFLNVAKKGTLEVPFRWKCSDGKYKNFVNYITYVISENKNENYIVGVWQEK